MINGVVHWRKLKVWARSHDLTMLVYEITSSFPRDERYNIVSQLRRATYSIPANIVEGQCRNTTKEYLSFLYNARGSLEEVRYFALLSKDLGFLTTDVYDQLEKECKEISMMLNALIKSLKNNH